MTSQDPAPGCHVFRCSFEPPFVPFFPPRSSIFLPQSSCRPRRLPLNARLCGHALPLFPRPHPRTPPRRTPLTPSPAGDLVYTNTEASGGQNPPGGSSYRSGVGNLPVQYLSQLDTIADGASGVAAIVPLTAQGALSGLMDDVQILREASTLNPGQANALMVKLSAALASLNRSNNNAACGQLTAFINQVNDLVASSVLSLAEGTALVEAANLARTLIPCP